MSVPSPTNNMHEYCNQAIVYRYPTFHITFIKFVLYVINEVLAGG
jgi:hypothetical protein